jgi:hypothetical protein
MVHKIKVYKYLKAAKNRIAKFPFIYKNKIEEIELDNRIYYIIIEIAGKPII